MSTIVSTDYAFVRSWVWWFCLLPWNAGQFAWRGRFVVGLDLVWPCSAAAPMGRTWSLYFAQRIASSTRRHDTANTWFFPDGPWRLSRPTGRNTAASHTSSTLTTQAYEKIRGGGCAAQTESRIGGWSCWELSSMTASGASDPLRRGIWPAFLCFPDLLGVFCCCHKLIWARPDARGSLEIETAVTTLWVCPTTLAKRDVSAVDEPWILACYATLGRWKNKYLLKRGHGGYAARRAALPPLDPLQDVCSQTSRQLGNFAREFSEAPRHVLIDCNGSVVSKTDGGILLTNICSSERRVAARGLIERFTWPSCAACGIQHGCGSGAGATPQRDFSLLNQAGYCCGVQLGWILWSSHRRRSM